MAGGLPNGELSQTPRAIARRQKQAKEKADNGDSIGNSHGNGNGNGSDHSDKWNSGSDEPISTMPVQVAETNPEPDVIEAQEYYSDDCNGSIKEGDRHCGTCGARLDWSG